MDKDTALRLALEVLADLGMKHYENTGEVLYKNTYTAIKAALEAKDEPVAQWQKKHATKTEGKWENTNGPDARWWLNNSVGWEIRALYTTPPQRKPLTDEEIMDALKLKSCDGYRAIVRAIEAAHSIKGEA